MLPLRYIVVLVSILSNLGLLGYLSLQRIDAERALDPAPVTCEPGAAHHSESSSQSPS